MDRKPLISICIPTFNREKYLDECLRSIFGQLTKDNFNNIEIIISDNNSFDKTLDVIKKYNKIKRIVYFKNDKNIGVRKNVIKVGTYAKGDYIWFLSDDDVHNDKSIKTVLDVILKYKPDVIFCNVDECSKDMGEITRRNLLNLRKDIYIHGRRDFYKFLSTKFLYAIDWYISYYTNLVISKEVFNLSLNLSKKYNSSIDLFPQSYGIFYSKKDYDIYIISKRIIKYRNFNLSFGPKSKKEYQFYWSKIYFNHYDNIVKINSDVLSLAFKLKLHLKKMIRIFRLYVLLSVFNY